MLSSAREEPAGSGPRHQQRAGASEFQLRLLCLLDIFLTICSVLVQGKEQYQDSNLNRSQGISVHISLGRGHRNGTDSVDYNCTYFYLFFLFRLGSCNCTWMHGPPPTKRATTWTYFMMCKHGLSYLSKVYIQ